MTLLRFCLLTSALCVIASPAPAQSVDLTLTRQGSETHHAFTDLQAAIAAARQARKQDPAVGISILLADGPFYLSEPVIIGPELSGTATTATRIGGRERERPELRASRVVRLHWREQPDGLQVADLDADDVEQLWVGGERQVLARYPNYDADILPLNGYAADALSRERAARWSHPEDGSVRAIHFSRWGGVVYRILGRAADGSVELGAPLANNRILPPQDKPHDRYRFVEGLFEELDAPGEWFFDRRARKLYLKPRPGVDLTSAEVEISTGASILRLVGDRSAPVHDVVIDGLSFSRARDTIFEATEPLVRSDWKIARQGAVFIEGARDVTVQNSDFHDLGGQAVFVSGFGRDVAIRGNAFWDVGGTAISFVGLSSAVRSPAFEYTQSVPLDRIDRTPGPLTEDYPSDSVADDNLIHAIGRSDKQAAGIEIAMASRITLSHNSIYDVPRAGINIGDGAWGGHVLKHNDVFDTVQESGDHGAFNSWGRDRFWMANRLAMDAAAAAEPILPFLDAVAPIVIRNNRFRSDHGWDIDLDDGSSNYEIHDNIMLAGGLKLREGFRRRVWNNVLINNSLHPHVWFKDSGDTFEHNIVMSPYQPILMPHWSSPIDNNLFPNEAALADAQRLGLDAHSLSGSPDFVDPANGDYRVRPASPALKIGFVNFDMDVGVRSPRLVAVARRPDFSPLLSDLGSAAGEQVELFGATMKSVETQGEQSAAGLPEISGVLVLSTTAGSPAATSGLLTGDVILKMVNSYDGVRYGEDLAVTDIADIVSIAQARKWQGVLKFLVQRNQQPQEIEIKF